MRFLFFPNFPSIPSTHHHPPPSSDSPCLATPRMFFFSSSDYCCTQPVKSTSFFINHGGYWICLRCRGDHLSNAGVMKWNQPYFSSTLMSSYRCSDGCNPAWLHKGQSSACCRLLLNICSILFTCLGREHSWLPNLKNRKLLQYVW